MPSEESAGRGKDPRCSVLVVDDDRPVAYLIEAVLQMKGYRVQLAFSAAEAAEVGASGYDLLLADLDLGSTTGVEVARQLCERWPTMCLLTMSGGAHPHLVTEARSLAAFRGHLAKPLPISTLVAAIEAALAGPCV